MAGAREHRRTVAAAAAEPGRAAARLARPWLAGLAAARATTVAATSVLRRAVEWAGVESTGAESAGAESVAELVAAKPAAEPARAAAEAVAVVVVPARRRRVARAPGAAECPRTGAREVVCRTSLASWILHRAPATFIRTASIASISSASSARACPRWNEGSMGKRAPIKWPSTTPARVWRTPGRATGSASRVALRTSAPDTVPPTRSSRCACSRCGTRDHRRCSLVKAIAFRSTAISST